MTSTLADENDEALAQLKAAFADRGVRGVVMCLNSLTPHRFTSVYRFDGPTLHDVTFFDREHPDVEHCEDIPVEASYCVFVRDGGAPFSVEDAARDDRVRHHVKREAVQRYCGVPLIDDDGKMFGSICHFDFKPGRVAARDVELLEYASRLLQQHL